MNTPKSNNEALQYHAGHRPGKIEILPTKATATQHDLSMAYSPGVAEPCKGMFTNTRQKATWWQLSAMEQPCWAWAILDPKRENR